GQIADPVIIDIVLGSISVPFQHIAVISLFEYVSFKIPGGGDLVKFNLQRLTIKTHIRSRTYLDGIGQYRPIFTYNVHRLYNRRLIFDLLLTRLSRPFLFFL